MRKLMMAAVAMSLVSTVAVAKDTPTKTPTTTESTKDTQSTTTSTNKEQDKTGPVNKEPHAPEIKDQGKSGTTLPPLRK